MEKLPRIEGIDSLPGATPTYDYREAMKLSNQLCFPLYAASRNVINHYTSFLKPLGITYTQYLVLLVLWEKDNLPVGEICQRLILDNGTLSPVLKKMEQAGLLLRSRQVADERVVLISLTEEGRALQEKAKDIPLKVGSCIPLSREHAQSLYSLLYEILDRDPSAES
ncbi:MAG: MarR family transcriptional regulator [Oscillospiraceae bacterium]|nr:MarR family transcriptional regulator [Oscillospiraceae bacterium]